MVARELAGQQLTMLLIVTVGFILYKSKTITKEGMAGIINLVINVVLPCNIIKSFLIKFSTDMVLDFAAVLVISLLVQFLCIFIGKTMYNRMEEDKKGILQFSTVCSNAAFLGNPVAETVYGSLGLSYASIYLIPQRIVMWSAGVSYFTKAPDKKAIVKSIVTHPCIIAVVVGLVCMICQVSFPPFANSAIGYLGGCSTPLSMLAIGATLGDVNLKSMADRKIIYFTIIRLGLIPLIVYLGCKMLQVDPVVAGVSVLLSAMPAGATTTIMAAKYNADVEFASKCVVFSTILSLITTVLWSILLSTY